MSKLKPFNINNNIKKELCKPLDKRLIKTRKSAGTELSYISGNTCIDILNKTFKVDIKDKGIIEVKK